MPKLSEAQKEVRRQQILSAAFNCLARLGYSRMTMRDIAKEAGISVGTLYLYFEHKDEIIAALQGESDSKAELDLQNRFGEGGPLEQLQSSLEYFFREMAQPDSSDMLRVDVQLWAESLHKDSLRDLVNRVLEEKIAQFAQLIKAAQNENQLPQDLEPLASARLIIAMIAGLQLQKAVQPKLSFEPLIGLLKTVSSHLDSDIDEKNQRPG